MATRPSIKGSAILQLVEDAARLLEGRLSREDAARWLEPEDFELLEQKIAIAAWYDIHSYRRLSELVRDVLGSGDNAYLSERGRQAAQRLLDAGLYTQFDYLHRMNVQSAEPSERFAAFGRDLRLIASIAPSMINFTRWTPKADPEKGDRYILEVSEAADYPEVLCWTTEGFINGMAATSSNRSMWKWSRPHTDLVLYHMTHPL